MTNSEVINQLQKGDNVLFKYIDEEDGDSTKMSVVLNVEDDRIHFKDIDGKFEFTKKYLINTNSVTMEIIEDL